MLSFLQWPHWPILSGILDVVLVSGLIYWILLLVRGTRAQAMLVGLGVLLVAYTGSSVFNLVTLNWLLDNFLGSVILVVVVLFQDDLRRALIKVGLGRGTIGSTPSHVVDNSIKEIAKASAVLSSRRIGALIVIERDVGLDDYTEAAVKVDALISYQLLVSIFHPTSPIHDGAVVVQLDRVVAAGTVLPLTFSANIQDNLGTRHRAALGLSERTDALVVVVSEETGSISLVREGRITRDLNETALYNALHRLTIFRAERLKMAGKSSRQSKASKSKAKKKNAPVPEKAEGEVRKEAGDVGKKPAPPSS